MRPYSVTYTPADDSTNGIATSTNSAAGVAFTQVATNAADNLAHLIIITPSKSVTGNYTITGTDADGKAQTETLATNTTSAVTSVKYYLTVTSVLAPAGITDATVQIGWTDDIVSPTYPLDWASTAAADIQVDVTGTINYTVQETFANVLAGTAAAWSSISALASKTALTASVASVGATAFRVLINSLTTGATFTIYTSQPVRR